LSTPRTEGFTRSTPVPLYWARYGESGAPQLLVLHGGPGAHHDYLLPQMLQLADTHELVFYDQRGGGRSKTDARDPITWRTQVDDLALVAQELISQPLTLVGYSWGALLALLYVSAGLTAQGTGLRAHGSGLTAHGPRLTPQASRLVLLSPASITRAHRAEFEREFAARQDSAWVRSQREELASSGLRESDPGAYRQRAFELSVSGYFAHPENARHLTPFRVTSRVQQSIWDSLGDFDIRPALQESRIPALIIHGRQDPIPLASSRELSEVLRGRLVVLDDCGHVPYVEGAAATFTAIREFLDQPAGSGAERA
jgi:proline iminopeptidase